MYELIDPKTGDYVVQKGRIVRTDPNQSLQVATFYRLRIHRTQWMYAPNAQYGSDMYLMDRRISQNDIRSVASVANRATKPMVDDGRAISANTVVDTTTRGAVSLKTTIITAQGNPVVSLVPIGG